MQLTQEQTELFIKLLARDAMVAEEAISLLKEMNKTLEDDNAKLKAEIAFLRFGTKKL